MAIKFGRPIEMRDAPRQQTAQAAPSLDLVVRPAPQSQGGMGAPAGAGKTSSPRTT